MFSIINAERIEQVARVDNFAFLRYFISTQN